MSFFEFRLDVVNDAIFTVHRIQTITSTAEDDNVIEDREMVRTRNPMR
jgi:hypothetical protein